MPVNNILKDNDFRNFMQQGRYIGAPNASPYPKIFPGVRPTQEFPNQAGGWNGALGADDYLGNRDKGLPLNPPDPVEPQTQGTGVPEFQPYKARNPLHQGVLGKSAIGGVKWGDLLGLGLLLSQPRGAIEMAYGWKQGVEGKRKQANDQYNEMLPIWQRQQQDQLDAMREEARAAETERHNREMERLGFARDASGTFGRVLPYDPAAAANLPGAPDGFVPTPGGIGTLEKNARTANTADANTDIRRSGHNLKVLTETGQAFVPGLTMVGPGGTPPTMPTTLGGRMAQTKAQTENTVSQTNYRDRVQTPDTQARTRRTNQQTDEATTMLPYNIQKANQDLAVLRSRIGLLGAQTERALRPPAPRGSGGRGGSTSGAKPAKPRRLTESERFNARVEKSLVDPKTWKEWEALGVAPGPQAQATVDYYTKNGLFDVDEDGVMYINKSKYPAVYTDYIKKQNMWRHGDLAWVNGREVPAKNGKPIQVKPKSQVQTIPNAPKRKRAEFPKGMTILENGNIVKR
jgi:hypothetical protein